MNACDGKVGLNLRVHISRIAGDQTGQREGLGFDGTQPPQAQVITRVISRAEEGIASDRFFGRGARCSHRATKADSIHAKRPQYLLHHDITYIRIYAHGDLTTRAKMHVGD